MDFDPETETIASTDQAKAFFRLMGCSGFHMSRDYPDRYEEYRALNIPRAVEERWRRERFFELHADAVHGRADLRIVHSSLDDLLDFADHDELAAMLDVTRLAVDARLPALDRIVIAETINGRTLRSARRGLLYRSYDAGHRDYASEFAKLGLALSRFTDADAASADAQRTSKLAHPPKPLNGVDYELLSLVAAGPSGEQLRKRSQDARDLCVNICRELGIRISSNAN